MWNITINEVFSHRGGAGIITTFTQQISPDSTVKQFLEALTVNPQNNQKNREFPIDYFSPFDPKSIGDRDRNSGRIVSQSNDNPNCTWNSNLINANTLIRNSGLCDGAVLQMSAMMCD